jgi:hypothetical protein
MSIIGVGPDEKDLRRFAIAIQELSAGRSNAAKTVTLIANATTTVVSFDNCSVDSVPLLMPMTANAAAEMGAGTLYISAVENRSFTITHANNAQTDRTFGFVCIG